MSEHWNPNDHETVITECERCGERLPCQYILDPFVNEGINDEPEEEEWWCLPCFDQRLGDV